MKPKHYILTFFILFSGLAFGQASGSADFSFNVKFEKDIPLEEIEIFYFNKGGNNFTKINYKLNISDNEIELFGNHHFIVGAGFPLIVFSHKGKMIYETTNEETETLNLFYLIIKRDTFHKDDEDFNKELKFSKEKPNVIVGFENVRGKIIYNILYEPTYFLPIYEMSISNQLVKVKPFK